MDIGVAHSPSKLRADRGAEVGELRRVGVRGRLDGTGPHMAEAAGHADSIGPDKVSPVVVRGIGVVPHRVPLARRVRVQNPDLE